MTDYQATPSLTVLLRKDAVKKVQTGYPWVFTHMMAMNSELETAEPGSLVQILDAKAKPIAIGYLNPKNALACRVLSLQHNAVIDQEFFTRLLQKALAKRTKWFPQPYYRLVHSESDGLPGLIIDRFGDIVVCQTSTAGMELLKPIWLPALEDVIRPTTIIFRDDVPARGREGLPSQVTVYKGAVDDLVEVQEGDVVYYANVRTGQKTGWFYDQRANRRYLAEHAQGKTMVDIYAHSGGFGIAAAKAGAAHVAMVDSSAMALELAQKAATRNGVSNQCEYTRADAYDWLQEQVKAGAQYDIVMADPPAFIKERKYQASGLKGYQKLAGLCAAIVRKGGMFGIASCSHHAQAGMFQKTVEQGISKAGRSYTLLHKAGADKDHIVHPLLPESQYLKFLVYQVD